MLLSFYVVNPSASVPSLVPIFQSFRPIIPLLRPCRLPRSLQVQSSLIPPSLGHPRSWLPLHIVQVAIYWAIVFWRWRTYVSTSSRTVTVITSVNGGYSHIPSVLRRGCIPASRQATLWWKPPRVCLIQVVITYFSDTNKSTAALPTYRRCQGSCHLPSPGPRSLILDPTSVNCFPRFMTTAGQ